MLTNKIWERFLWSKSMNQAVGKVLNLAQVDKTSTAKFNNKPILTDLKSLSSSIRGSVEQIKIPMNQNYQSMAKEFRLVTSERRTSICWKVTSRIKSSNCHQTLKSINWPSSEFKVWSPKNMNLLKKSSIKTLSSLKINSLKMESKRSSGNHSFKKFSKRPAPLLNKTCSQLKRNSSTCNIFFKKGSKSKINLTSKSLDKTLNKCLNQLTEKLTTWWMTATINLQKETKARGPYCFWRKK
jgi:hypothetical protein